ncbi:MAG: hypothetical protein HKN14_13335 [Marinicaulis sp.]|nr:hypothetical protein [Marinicaulis sp.]
MGKYHEGLRGFFKDIDDNVKAEKNSHRKAILDNYLKHAALEYTDRWKEIFDPVRTVAHPVYKVRWGTDEDVIYDGPDAVQGFYRTLKDDTFLTNQDQLLAVNDWGFTSFLKIILHMNAEKARREGFEVDDDSAQYALETPCAMYWLYDDKAKLIGEYVYEIGKSTYSKTAPSDVITDEDVQEIVAPYLPPVS